MFRRPRPMSIGDAASTIVEAGHTIAQLQAENARLRAAIARHGADAPRHLQAMRERGWVFTFDPATQFIAAQHGRGGEFPIAEMRGRLTSADRGEFGAYIAAALNGR
jgi:hypothetical protein